MRIPRLLRSVAVAALALLAFESAARSFGWLDPTERPDPYMGFPGTSPLYRHERATSGADVLRRSPNKAASYRHAEFPAEKPAHEFRVFCIGGSSVRCDAFMQPDASFPHLLELYLGGLLAERVPRVINAGGGGTGSIQNLEVLREALDHAPDLLVVYPEGGEKNLIPPLPQGLMAEADEASPVRVLARRGLTRLRLYHGVREAYQGLLPPRPAGAAAVSAFSSFALYAVSRPFSPQTFTRLFEFKFDRAPPVMPHPIAPETIRHAHERFLGNLGAMAELARARRVPLLFVIPVRNLKAPFYLRFHVDPSEIRDGDVAGWRSDWERGLQARREERWEDALAAFADVRRRYVEDRDEILAFTRGECLERLGRHAEARAEYAKPYLEHPMRGLVERAAAQHQVPLVDPYPALAAVSENGVPGYDLFTDSFHPMPETNRLIALSVLDRVRTEGLSLPHRPTGDARLAAAEGRVQDILRRSSPPDHSRMMRAILARDYAEAVRIGRAIPQEVLTQQVVESLCLGWALTRQGDLAGAQQLLSLLRSTWWKPGLPLLALETDEDMVINAFGGDLFAWF